MVSIVLWEESGTEEHYWWAGKANNSAVLVSLVNMTDSLVQYHDDPHFAHEETEVWGGN